MLPTKGVAAGGEVVTIEAADLGGAEGLRGVLGDFYRRTVGTFPQAAQRSVRHLCEDGLISKSGRRLSLEREEIHAQYNVPPAVLHDLVDQRLLRVEPRVGSEYYELSHDTLVKPILADRSERRKAMLRRRRRFALRRRGRCRAARARVPGVSSRLRRGQRVGRVVGVRDPVEPERRRARSGRTLPGRRS